MAVTGMSFYYGEEKAQALKDAAKSEGRTLSGYLQIVLQNDIDGVVEIKKPAPKKKFKRVIKRRRK